MGFEISYYDIDENLNPIIDFDNFQSIGIFFHMGYFGFNTNNNLKDVIKKLNQSKAVIVEDITHSFLSQNHHDFESDYYICSLRKWFGIPDGAFIASNVDLNPNEFQKNSEYVEQRILADKLKKQYINKEIEHQDYLKIYDKAEDLLNKNEIHLMNEESKSILYHTDFDTIKSARRNNYLYLESLLNSKKICVIPLEKNTVPLSLPLFINNRDVLRKRMIENKVYCPVHWPIPNVENMPKNGIYVKQISIPIDQRYNNSDMQYIYKILQEWE